MDMCMEKGSIEKVPHIFQSALYLEEIPWVLLYMVTNLRNFKADKNVLLYFCFSLAISGTSEQNHTFKKIMDYHICFTNMEPHYLKTTIFKAMVTRDYCIFQNFLKHMKGQGHPVIYVLMWIRLLTS